MTTREAIDELAQRGIRVTEWVLRGLLERGEVPRPRLNSSLRFDWTDDDIAAVVRAVEGEVRSR